MRSYLIDEISSDDIKKIDTFLKKRAIKSNLEQVFWLEIPDDLLSSDQQYHVGCQPHVFAIEISQDWVKLEFFVRTLKKMTCSCLAYCTPQQRDYIINFAQGMIEKLKIAS